MYSMAPSSIRRLISALSIQIVPFYARKRLYAGFPALHDLPAIHLRAAIFQAGDLRPCSGDRLQIDISHYDTGGIWRLCQNQSPGIDDHRTSKTLPVGRIRADLGGRDDIAQILDRTRAQKHFPVISPGV